jgi:hypothetical protein
MTAGVNVLVEWTKAKRSRLPSSGKYITVAKFPEDIDWPQGKTWSVVLEFFSRTITNPQVMEAKASFLVPEGPRDRLSKGKTFELYEGRTHTATVKVV